MTRTVVPFKPNNLRNEAAVDGAASARAAIPFDKALAYALGLAAQPVAVETVSLQESLGRILATTMRSPFPLPSFDNAAMDGYALRTDDLAGEGPWTLAVGARIAAGDAHSDVSDLPPGTAVRILTGAPVPPTFDAVVMQEHVRRQGDTIEVFDRAAPGLNIRRIGEDAKPDSIVVGPGTLIGAREAGALAAIGQVSLPVRRRLRVAFLSTGNELREPGQTLAPGQVFDSNRYTLLGALSASWVEPVDLGFVEDSPDALEAAIVAACSQADMVVSTGGVSVGDADYLPEVFRSAGGDLRAMKVAMKPGKPVAVGRLNDAVYLGLPGNPVAAFVGWLTIGEPMARSLAGFADIRHASRYARLDHAEQRRSGRREFRPARIVGRDSDGVSRVRLLDSTFTARIALLCQADGLAVLPAEADTLAAGMTVEFMAL